MHIVCILRGENEYVHALQSEVMMSCIVAQLLVHCGSEFILH